jgi:hypothetical protein
MKLFSVALLVFALNVPFGYWRANVPKLSRPWFFAIHLPVPFVIAIRMLSGLGWQLITFPVMIGAFFGGQFAGSWLYRLRKDRAASASVSSCLVWDLIGPARRTGS